MLLLRSCTRPLSSDEAVGANHIAFPKSDMRDFNTNSNAFELLPTDSEARFDNERQHKELSADNFLPGVKSTPKFWALPGVRHILYSLLLLAAIAPIAILLAYSSTLSRLLSYNGCTTNGGFTLPFTTGVWDTKRLFTITIAFAGPFHATCVYDSTSSQALTCNGYSFTQVKVIDIAWDIVIGRGGQALLIVVAYRLFSRVIKMLMTQGEVGYDTFVAVAFNSGSASSFITLLRHAVGMTLLPRTRHAVFAYWIMALACVGPTVSFIRLKALIILIKVSDWSYIVLRAIS